MKNIGNRFVLVTALLLLLTGLLACQAPNGSTNGEFSGFLEGDKIDVASEMGGRITTIDVQEGTSVSAGQHLVSFQDDVIRARVAAADANIAAAQAQLALLEAGARKEDVARAQAQVDKARSTLKAATQALTDTLAIRANPQTLLIAQAQAQMRAQVTASQLAAAASQAQSADEINRYLEQQTRMLWEGFDIYLPGNKLHFDAPSRLQIMSQEEWQKAGNAAWQSWAGVEQAQANANAAAANLADISDMVKNPIALDARVHQASAARDQAEAGVQAAQAALLVLREGATPAQLAAARAAAEQARAARATLDQELARFQIQAPRAGTATKVYYRAGEVALPGAPLVRLKLDGDLTLRLFVPMSALDKVRVGMNLPVKVEGLDQSFKGTVVRIGERAEFTGRQSQTDQERNAQLVSLEIALGDSGVILKAGMPATVDLK